MKKYLLLFMSAMMLAIGCYDDTDIRKELQDHENRISELETLCKQFNTNISSLQIAVSGLEKNVYVSTVAPIKSGQDEIGYVITFTNSQSITIYHGNDGKNGIDGNDGASPALGVKKDNDNVYYWTLNGEWLTDSDGNKIQASGRDGMNGTPGQNGTNGMNGQDGITPQLKIVDGYWYVSYDGGKNWESETLGQATGDKGYTMFEEVTYDTEYVYITMTGGEKLALPRATTFVEGDVIGPATVTLSEVASDHVEFDVRVDIPEKELPYFEMKIYYSCDVPFSVKTASYKLWGPYVSGFEANTDCLLKIDNLKSNKVYHYCVCVETRTGKVFGDVQSFVIPDEMHGQWVMNKIVTTSENLDDLWCGMCTYNGLPGFNASDAISFDMPAGKAVPSFSSTYKNYFIGESSIRELGTYKLSVDIMTQFELRLFEFDNINRYFHPTEKSEDTTAYVGFRVITDAVTGEELLDMYVIDHTSKSFMPELLEVGLYDTKKPVAAMIGMYLNATFKRQPDLIY